VNGNDNTGVASLSDNARERTLAAAGTLFYRDGIHATGVERVARHAQVSKRTLYQHFSSKDRLVEEYLRRIHDTGGMPNEKTLDTLDATPARCHARRTPGGVGPAVEPAPEDQHARLTLRHEANASCTLHPGVAPGQSQQAGATDNKHLQAHTKADYHNPSSSDAA
jgi:AcrR family transcriptional regulator